MPALLPITGPLTTGVVISRWALLIAVGFALIYWPRFPKDFTLSQPEPTQRLGRFWTVLYLSLASLTTLGSSDLTAQAFSTRIVTALESLFGISLTASTSSPVLGISCSEILPKV